MTIRVLNAILPSAMVISFLIKSRLTSLLMAKIVLAAVPVFVFLFILNQNFAFTGVHRVSISSFTDLPRSVQYVGGADVGVVSTPEGKRTRPYTDQVKFAVTLPRGFDTMTMTAEVDADPYATLILDAKAAPTNNQATAFHMPTAFGSDWRSTTLDGGRLQLRDHENVKTADEFWAAIKTFRRVYTLSGDLTSLIPPSSYASSAQLTDVRLAADYRGSLILSAYLDSGTKDIRFTKKDLNFTSGADTLRFTLERGGKILVAQNVGDDTGKSQDAVVDLPELAGGFYTLRFTPNNEDSMVRNIQFRGTEVHIQNRIFLGQAPNALTFYITCPSFTAEAVHNLGLKASFTINGRKIALKAIKKAQEVIFTGPVGTIVIPRGDVSLTSSCGFQLKPEHPVRDALNALTKRIVPLPEFSAAALKNVEAVFDDAQLAQQKTKSGYIIEKTFNLHKLSVKGKTFTFSLENPGLTTRPGAFLHIKKITFTAKRPAFSFSDIGKAFKALAKQ